MKKVMMLVLTLMVLVACGGTDDVETAVSDPVGNEETAVVVPVSSERSESVIELDDAYEDALPVQMQLAIGTILLEGETLAVDGTQAADLLPLWQGVEGMTASGMAADAEITAVVNQIQTSMTAEQIAAIADMQLTQEAMRELIQSGTIEVEIGDVKRGSDDGGGTRGGPPDGVPGGGGGGQADPSQQAERAGSNDIFGQALMGVVVQLLKGKVG